MTVQPTSGPVPVSAPRPSDATLDFVFGQVETHLKGQDAQWDNLRTKAAIVLGSAGLVFTRVVELRVQVAPEAYAWTLGLQIGAGALVFLSAVFALRALDLRNIRTDPHPRNLTTRLLAPVAELRLQVLSNLVDATEKNNRRLAGVTGPLRASIRLLIIGLGLYLGLGVAQWSFPWNPSPSGTQTDQPSPRNQTKCSPTLPSRSPIRHSATTQTDTVPAPRSLERSSHQ